MSAVRTARYRTPKGTWTRHRIIEAMLVWRSETGAPPRSYDWAPDTGRAMRMLGPELAKFEREHPRWPSTSCVVDHFGSWSAALRAAGLPARIPERDMSRRERVEAARELHENGWSVARIADELQLAPSTVRCYVNAMPCPACGDFVLTAYLGRGARTCQPCAARATKAPAWTPALIIDALRRWEAETGEAPKRDDWSATPSRGRPRHPKFERDYPRWPSAAEVVTHFPGGWSTALRAARLQLRLSAPWTREAIIDALRSWEEQHGRPPRPADWLRADPGVSPDRSTVLRTFGRWAAALEAAHAPPSTPAL